MSAVILRAIIAMPRYFPHLPLDLIVLPSGSVSLFEFIPLDSIKIVFGRRLLRIKYKELIEEISKELSSFFL